MLGKLKELTASDAIDVSRWEIFVKGIWRYFRHGELPELATLRRKHGL